KASSGRRDISTVATNPALAPPFARDLPWTGGVRCRGRPGRAGAAAGVGEQADLVHGPILRSRSVIAVTNRTLSMCQTPARTTATLARPASRTAGGGWPTPGLPVLRWPLRQLPSLLAA